MRAVRTILQDHVRQQSIALLLDRERLAERAMGGDERLHELALVSGIDRDPARAVGQRQRCEIAHLEADLPRRIGSLDAGDEGDRVLGGERLPRGHVEPGVGVLLPDLGGDVERQRKVGAPEDKAPILLLDVLEHIPDDEGTLRALLVLSIPALFRLTESLYAVYAVAFCTFLLGVFFNAAKMALIPELVPRDQLLPANAALTFVGRFATVLGIVGGGVIIGMAFWRRFGWSDYAAGFYLDGGSYLVSVLTLLAIVVAVNKIDREGADPTRVRTEMTQLGLQPVEGLEGRGGEHPAEIPDHRLDRHTQLLHQNSARRTLERRNRTCK